jgi:hypothetical protein
MVLFFGGDSYAVLFGAAISRTRLETICFFDLSYIDKKNAVGSGNESFEHQIG